MENTNFFLRRTRIGKPYSGTYSSIIWNITGLNLFIQSRLEQHTTINSLLRDLLLLVCFDNFFIYSHPRRSLSRDAHLCSILVYWRHDPRSKQKISGRGALTWHTPTTYFFHLLRHIFPNIASSSYSDILDEKKKTHHICMEMYVKCIT